MYITFKIYMMIEKLTKSVGCGLAIGALLISTLQAKSEEKTPPTYVNVGEVKEITVPETITAVGHLYAINQVNLSFNNSGKLEHKYFKNGDRVLAGESVASLDDTQDMANLKSLQAQLNLAKQTYQRVQLLKKSGAISQEDIDQKFADLQQAKANVEQQQNVVQQDTLKAPLTGVLGIYQFDVGAYIPSGTAVVQLTQENPLKIRFAIPSDFKPKVAIGNEVSLTTNTYKDKTFTGKVNYISPTVNTDSGTIQIEAEVANDDYLLSPGMFMSVSQILKEDKKILVIPDMAVQVEQQGSFVYALEGGDTVKKVPIETGIIRSGWTQVESGLKKGQKIVTIGGNKLFDGAKVSISDIPPPNFEALSKKIKINMNTDKSGMSTPSK